MVIITIYIKAFSGFLQIGIAIFGPFLDLQEFFKNLGFSFETSDSDFCDLLNELFLKDQNFFEKKIKFSKVILKSHIMENNKNT